MVVYIQKKINGKWCTILPVSQEASHRTCGHLIFFDPKAEYRIAESSGAD